ncbi:MAG TPA: DUF2179 domain-containing protein [Bacteroidia bacterium]|nr:DUF2179 domain-containing protein [Bacteroidia bacterium]
MNSDDLFKWVLLPLFIFLARTTDVSLGTLRNVFINKGFRRVVPFIAFFEVLIWLISIGQIMKNLSSPLCYIAFAGGFAMGTYVGLLIEKRLALGMQVLSIITAQDSKELVQALSKANVGVTIVDAHGAKGPVKIIFTIIKQKDLPEITAIINKYQPNAFYSLEDVRHANLGVFPELSGSRGMDYVRRIFPGGMSK